MSLLRCSLLEARNLGRVLGIWPYLALCLWPLFVKLQQPDFFLSEEVPFYWASLESLLLVGLGLLPLAMRLCQRSETEWMDGVSRDPVSLTLVPWLAVVMVGLPLCLATLLSSYTVERIMGGAADAWVYSLALAMSGLHFLGLTASLSSLLLRIRVGTPSLVFGWVAFLATAMHLFGPPQNLPAPDISSPGVWGLLSTLCVTLGGLLFSLSHSQHQLRS